MDALIDKFIEDPNADQNAIETIRNVRDFYVLQDENKPFKNHDGIIGRFDGKIVKLDKAVKTLLGI